MQPAAATKAPARTTRASERVGPPLFLDGVLFNRANRRRLAKASRCIVGETKVPGRIRVALGGAVVDGIADHLGKKVAADGAVTAKIFSLAKSDIGRAA